MQSGRTQFCLQVHMRRLIIATRPESSAPPMNSWYAQLRIVAMSSKKHSTTAQSIWDFVSQVPVVICTGMRCVALTASH